MTNNFDFKINSEERFILTEFFHDKSRYEIAKSLNIHQETLGLKVKSIRDKLDVKNTSELLLKASCLDREINRIVHYKASIITDQVNSFKELTLLEKAFVIEIFSGLNDNNLHQLFGGPREQIANTKRKIWRKLKVVSKLDLLVKLVALGVITYRVNYVPMDLINQDNSIVWNYFQEHLKSQDELKYPYSPIFKMHSSKHIGLASDSYKILQYRVYGFSNMQISKLTGFSRQTITKKLSVIKSTHGLSNASELVRWAIKNDLVELHDINTPSAITGRNFEILKKMEEGYNNEQTAELLNIKMGTVTYHLTRLKKLWKVKTQEGIFYKWELMKIRERHT